MADITTVPDDLAAHLIKNEEFILDLARYADGILTEEQIRRAYHVFSDDTWSALGECDELVEKIENLRIKRTRSGQTKKELAQKYVAKGPAILDSIMTDERENARHRIDAVAKLDQLAGGEREAGPTSDPERFVISIVLSADERIVINKPRAITPADNGKIIEHTEKDHEPW
jgi:hypothetical protein